MNLHLYLVPNNYMISLSMISTVHSLKEPFGLLSVASKEVDSYHCRTLPKKKIIVKIPPLLKLFLLIEIIRLPRTDIFVF